MNFSNLMRAGVKRTTNREAFLADMEKIVPLADWRKLIEPYYYVKRAGGRGSPSMGIDKMLIQGICSVFP